MHTSFNTLKLLPAHSAAPPPRWISGFYQRVAFPDLRLVVFHPAGNPGANRMSISHRCYLREVACEWELTKMNYLFAPGLSPG